MGVLLTPFVCSEPVHPFVCSEPVLFWQVVNFVVCSAFASFGWMPLFRLGELKAVFDGDVSSLKTALWSWDLLRHGDCWSGSRGIRCDPSSFEQNWPWALWAQIRVWLGAGRHKGGPSPEWVVRLRLRSRMERDGSIFRQSWKRFRRLVPLRWWIQQQLRGCSMRIVVWISWDCFERVKSFCWAGLLWVSLWLNHFHGSSRLSWTCIVEVVNCCDI